MISVLEPILRDVSVHALSLTSSMCSSLSSWPWTVKVNPLGTLGSLFLEMELKPAMKLEALIWANNEPP